jgi:hypothetical protein
MLDVLSTKAIMTWLRYSVVIPPLAYTLHLIFSEELFKFLFGVEVFYL